ncbi:MAG: hypothetical protein ACE5I4_01725 [Thermoplasmata archaeon]
MAEVPPDKAVSSALPLTSPVTDVEWQMIFPRGGFVIYLLECENATSESHSH